jgi:acyl-coenzyme A thioesterase PaaI-like protein
MTVLPVLDMVVDHVPEHVAEDQQPQHPSSATGSVTSSHLPDWVQDGQELNLWGEELNHHDDVPEWQDDEDGTYRKKHGWQGRDLVHDKDSPVRVLHYYVQYGDGRLTSAATPASATSTTLDRGGIGTTLTGIAHFTHRAESHKGYCHGGSMCSLLDDVIGWVSFVVTGRCLPWTGFTVQVNSSLKRPVPVDSILLVRATISNIERRKVSVEASIVDPKDDDAVHATGTGLVVMNRGVLPET